MKTKDQTPIPLKGQKIKTFNKVISLATVILFSLTTVASSAPMVNPGFVFNNASFLANRVEVPEGLGTIQERFVPERSQTPHEVSLAMPAIFHIQDAHAHYEAQQNIKNILHFLTEQYDIELVFLEGVIDQLNPDFLKFFNEDAHNLKAADLMARDGIVNGAELFLLENKSKKMITVRGVEDKELYRRNLQAFRDVFNQKEKSEQFLGWVKGELEKILSRIAHKPLQAFFREWLFYQDTPHLLQHHIKTLARFAQDEMKLDLSNARNQKDWPQLVRILKLEEMEKAWDPNQAEKEKEKLTGWMKEMKLEVSALPQLEAIESKIQGQKKANGEIRKAVEQFYDLLQPQGFSFQNYPQLSKQWGLAILQSEIDANTLMKEMDDLTKVLLERLAETQEEKNLISLYQDYLLVKKLISLKLVQEDYQRLTERRSEMSPSAFSDKIKQAAASIKIKPSPVSVKDVDAIFEKALAFYDDAAAREKIIFEKMTRTMKETGKTNAILITGGFHAQGLKRQFKENEISYAEIMPHISEITDNKNYVNNMTLQGDYLTRRSYANLPSFSDGGIPGLRANFGAATAEHYEGMSRVAVDTVMAELAQEGYDSSILLQPDQNGSSSRAEVRQPQASGEQAQMGRRDLLKAMGLGGVASIYGLLGDVNVGLPAMQEQKAKALPFSLDVSKKFQLDFEHPKKYSPAEMKALAREVLKKMEKRLGEKFDRENPAHTIALAKFFGLTSIPALDPYSAPINDGDTYFSDFNKHKDKELYPQNAEELVIRFYWEGLTRIGAAHLEQDVVNDKQKLEKTRGKVSDYGTYAMFDKIKDLTIAQAVAQGRERYDVQRLLDHFKAKGVPHAGSKPKNATDEFKFDVSGKFEPDFENPREYTQQDMDELAQEVLGKIKKQLDEKFDRTNVEHVEALAKFFHLLPDPTLDRYSATAGAKFFAEVEAHKDSNYYPQNEVELVTGFYWRGLVRRFALHHKILVVNDKNSSEPKITSGKLSDVAEEAMFYKERGGNRTTAGARKRYSQAYLVEYLNLKGIPEQNRTAKSEARVNKGWRLAIGAAITTGVLSIPIAGYFIFKPKARPAPTVVEPKYPETPDEIYAYLFSNNREKASKGLSALQRDGLQGTPDYRRQEVVSRIVDRFTNEYATHDDAESIIRSLIYNNASESDLVDSLLRTYRETTEAALKEKIQDLFILMVKVWGDTPFNADGVLALESLGSLMTPPEREATIAKLNLELKQWQDEIQREHPLMLAQSKKNKEKIEKALEALEALNAPQKESPSSSVQYAAQRGAARAIDNLIKTDDQFVKVYKFLLTDPALASGREHRIESSLPFGSVTLSLGPNSSFNVTTDVDQAWVEKIRQEGIDDKTPEGLKAIEERVFKEIKADFASQKEESKKSRSELRGNMDRRKFLKVAGATGIAASIPFELRAAEPKVSEKDLGTITSSFSGITNYLKPDFGIHGPTGAARDHIMVDPDSLAPLELGNYGAPGKDAAQLQFLWHLAEGNPLFSQIKKPREEVLAEMFKAIQVLRAFQKNYEADDPQALAKEVKAGFLPWNNKLDDGTIRAMGFNARIIVPSLENSMLTMTLAGIAGSYWDAPEGSMERRIRDLAVEFLDHQHYEKFMDKDGKIFQIWDFEKDRPVAGSSLDSFWTEWGIAYFWTKWIGVMPEKAFLNMPHETFTYESEFGPLDMPQGFIFSFHELWGLQYFHHLIMQSKLAPLMRNWLYLHAQHARDSKLPGFVASEYAPDGQYKGMGIDVPDHTREAVKEDQTVSSYGTALGALIDPKMLSWLAYLFEQPGVVKEKGFVTSFNRRDGAGFHFTADNTFVTLAAAAEAYNASIDKPNRFLSDGMTRFLHERYGLNESDLIASFDLIADNILKKLGRDHFLAVTSEQIPTPPEARDYSVTPDDSQKTPETVFFKKHLIHGDWHARNTKTPDEFNIPEWKVPADRERTLPWVMKPDASEIAADYELPEGETFAFIGTTFRPVRISDSQWISYWVPADMEDEHWAIELKSGQEITKRIQIDTSQKPVEISDDGKWKRYIQPLEVIGLGKRLPLVYVAISTGQKKGRIHIKDIEIYKTKPASARSEARAKKPERKLGFEKLEDRRLLNSDELLSTSPTAYYSGMQPSTVQSQAAQAATMISPSQNYTQADINLLAPNASLLFDTGIVSGIGQTNVTKVAGDAIRVPLDTTNQGFDSGGLVYRDPITRQALDQIGEIVFKLTLDKPIPANAKLEIELQSEGNVMKKFEIQNMGSQTEAIFAIPTSNFQELADLKFVQVVLSSPHTERNQLVATFTTRPQALEIFAPSAIHTTQDVSNFHPTGLLISLGTREESEVSFQPLTNVINVKVNPDAPGDVSGFAGGGAGVYVPRVNQNTVVLEIGSTAGSIVDIEFNDPSSQKTVTFQLQGVTPALQRYAFPRAAFTRVNMMPEEVDNVIALALKNNRASSGDIQMRLTPVSAIPAPFTAHFLRMHTEKGFIDRVTVSDQDGGTPVFVRDYPHNAVDQVLARGNYLIVDLSVDNPTGAKIEVFSHVERGDIGVPSSLSEIALTDASESNGILTVRATSADQRGDVTTEINNRTVLSTRTNTFEVIQPSNKPITAITPLDLVRSGGLQLLATNAARPRSDTLTFQNYMETTATSFSFQAQTSDRGAGVIFQSGNLSPLGSMIVAASGTNPLLRVELIIVIQESNRAFRQVKDSVLLAVTPELQTYEIPLSAFSNLDLATYDAVALFGINADTQRAGFTMQVLPSTTEQAYLDSLRAVSPVGNHVRVVDGAGQVVFEKDYSGRSSTDIVDTSVVIDGHLIVDLADNTIEVFTNVPTRNPTDAPVVIAGIALNKVRRMHSKSVSEGVVGAQEIILTVLHSQTEPRPYAIHTPTGRVSQLFRAPFPVIAPAARDFSEIGVSPDFVRGRLQLAAAGNLTRRGQIIGDAAVVDAAFDQGIGLAVDNFGTSAVETGLLNTEVTVGIYTTAETIRLEAVSYDYSLRTEAKQSVMLDTTPYTFQTFVVSAIPNFFKTDINRLRVLYAMNPHNAQHYTQLFVMPGSRENIKQTQTADYQIFSSTDNRKVLHIVPLRPELGRPLDLPLNAGNIAALDVIHKNLVRIKFENDLTAYLYISPAATPNDQVSVETHFLRHRSLSATVDETIRDWRNEDVWALYHEILHRAPEPGGLAYWVGNLESGQLLFSQVRNGFLASTERLGQLAIPEIYRQTFNREPEAGGLAFWTQRLNSGEMTIAQIEQAIRSSNEAFVRNSYRDFLGRQPEQNGYDFWWSRLENETLTREQVAQGFRNSPEYQGRVTNALTQELFYFYGRTPTSAEINFWVPKFVSGEIAAWDDLAESLRRDLTLQRALASRLPRSEIRSTATIDAPTTADYWAGHGASFEAVVFTATAAAQTISGEHRKYPKIFQALLDLVVQEVAVKEKLDTQKLRDEVLESIDFIQKMMDRGELPNGRGVAVQTTSGDLEERISLTLLSLPFFTALAKKDRMGEFDKSIIFGGSQAEAVKNAVFATNSSLTASEKSLVGKIITFAQDTVSLGEIIRREVHREAASTQPRSIVGSMTEEEAHAAGQGVLQQILSNIENLEELKRIKDPVKRAETYVVGTLLLMNFAEALRLRGTKLKDRPETIRLLKQYFEKYQIQISFNDAGSIQGLFSGVSSLFETMRATRRSA